MRSDFSAREILAKQCLIGVSGDPFVSSEKLALAPAKSFLAVAVFLLWFWASLLIIFKSFVPFGSFFTLKTNLSDTPSNLINLAMGKTAWWSGATSLRLLYYHHWRFYRSFSHMVIPTRTPTSSGSKLAPLSSSRLWQEALESALHRVTVHSIEMQTH